MPFMPRVPRTALAAVGVLAFCMVMTALGRGMGETFAVFLLPLGEEFGWERASVVSIYTLYMVATGIGSPLAGVTFDRFGARFVYTAGLAALALGYWLAGRLTELWQFYICISIMGGIGAAMIGIVPTQSLVSRWFDRRLATALALAYAGLGLGTQLLAPVSQLTIEATGWRAAYGHFGLMFALLVPLVLVMPWRRIAEGAAGNPRSAPRGKATSGPVLRDVIWTWTFWAFFLIFFLTAAAVYSVSLEVVAYLVELGYTKLHAASVFGSAALVSFAGMTLTGIAADRWSRPVVATFSFGLTIIGIGAVALIQVWPSPALPFVFIVCFGLSMGARGPIITTLMAQIFAGRGLGSIYGFINLGQGLGAGAGAFMAGLLYDLTGGYNTGFAASVACAVAGAALFWMVPEIRRDRPAR